MATQCGTTPDQKSTLKDWHRRWRNAMKYMSSQDKKTPFFPNMACRPRKTLLTRESALHIVNMARAGDGYRHIVVDRAFEDVLGEICPDIVHIGHLNHLSTSLVFSAKEHKIPIVFTLHDYWLMCPRGQFIQRYPEDLSDVWSVCDGQDDRKCAVRCYARYFSGSEDEYEQDAAHWTDWVGRRMAHVREVCDAVDMFIAPSRYLLNRFRDEFGIPEQKLTYLDYGFHLDRLECRSRVAGEAFTFGYIGTHIPAKGVNHLIESFGRLKGDATLRIWGRDRGMETQGLKVLARSLPNSADSRIEWMGEYKNQDIVPDVFNRCDTIVVPSIWAENSPLVIHEALQARVPVITADYGGMAEYVHHELNGLLFAHRDPRSLAEQMQRLADDPQLARQLGSRGYLQSDDGNVPDMVDHSLAVEEIYKSLIS